MKLVQLGTIGLALATVSSGAAPRPSSMPPPLPPLREQDRIRQEWLKLRLERVLPDAHAPARRRDVARRVPRVQRGPGLLLAGLALGDGGPPPHHPGLQRPRAASGAWSGWPSVAARTAGSTRSTATPTVESRELWGQGQWALLRKLVEERKPPRIAINISQTHAFSDGLSRRRVGAARGRARPLDEPRRGARRGPGPRVHLHPRCPRCCRRTGT